MSDRTLQPEPDDPALPHTLAGQLVAALGRRPDVPAAIDTVILQEAKAGFGRRRRFRVTARWAGAATAAAAAVVIVALNFRPDRPATPAVVAGDVDRSGRVDILDAFVLARRVDAGAGDPNADVNGDGAVDRQDVDRVAAMAVRLR